MRRVLLLSHAANLGGAERCLLTLVGQLPRLGFDCTVGIPQHGILEERLKPLGVTSMVLPYESCLGDGGNCAWQLGANLSTNVEHLMRVIREHRIEVVVTNTLATMEGAFAAAHARIPHVWYAHELLSHHTTLKPLGSLPTFLGLVGMLSDRVVACSHAVAGDLTPHIPGDKVRIVHTGLPDHFAEPLTRSQIGVSNDAPLILFAGAMFRHKGIFDLLEAMPIVLQSIPTAEFVLAGPDAGDLATLRASARRTVPRSKIHILGFREDVPSLIAAADLLVLPSYGESFSLVILEAMRAGKPVVATDCGGPSELVVHGETGLLVPVAEPSRLGEAIAMVLQDRTLAQRLGQAGRQRYESRFHESQYIDRFATCLTEAIQMGNRESPRTAPLALVQSMFRDLAMERAANTYARLAWARIEGNPILGRLLSWRRRVLRQPAGPSAEFLAKGHDERLAAGTPAHHEMDPRSC